MSLLPFILPEMNWVESFSYSSTNLIPHSSQEFSKLTLSLLCQHVEVALHPYR